jgi:hypothetical protein
VKLATPHNPPRGVDQARATDSEVSNLSCYCEPSFETQSTIFCATLRPNSIPLALSIW